MLLHVEQTLLLIYQSDPGRVCLAGRSSVYNNMLSASVDLCKHQPGPEVKTQLSNRSTLFQSGAKHFISKSVQTRDALESAIPQVW